MAPPKEWPVMPTLHMTGVTDLLLFLVGVAIDHQVTKCRCQYRDAVRPATHMQVMRMGANLRQPSGKESAPPAMSGMHVAGCPVR
jgi:hypothetical protein